MINNKGFSEDVIDNAIKILEADLNPKLSKNTKKALWKELNFIKQFSECNILSDSWVQPAKTRNRIRRHREKIHEALIILHSFEDGINKSLEEQKLINQEKMLLYAASPTSLKISGGLVDYDITSFDHDFALAIQSLEKIKHYYDTIFDQAENATKGRGGTKPPDKWQTSIFYICRIYKNFTQKPPIISVDYIEEIAKGSFVKFLEYLLKELSYPKALTHQALERHIRDLKTNEIYRELWFDGKK